MPSARQSQGQAQHSQYQHGAPSSQRSSSQENDANFPDNVALPSPDTLRAPLRFDNMFNIRNGQLPLEHRPLAAPDSSHAEPALANAANSQGNPSELEPPVPLAGGCVFVHDAANATIQDSSFSNCASSAVGGSIALIHVTTALILRTIFSDSLVHVVNSSFLSQPVDRTLFNRTIAEIPGVVRLPGGVGYGGAVLIIASYSSGVTISVSGCTFVRCQVLAMSDDYDFFLRPFHVNGSDSGLLLQGGAIAAFLPIVNKSGTADPGYMFSVSKSTFTQCILLCTSVRVPIANFDVAVGGAISVFDLVPNNPFPQNISFDSSFILAPSRVVLQDITLSGKFAIDPFVMDHRQTRS